MATLGVCYLVRKAHGPQTFARFLDSYTKHPAGVEHDLVLIFKGFDSESIPPEYLSLLDDTQYQSLFVEDKGFDIGAYFAASERLDYEYLCFLNSYSVILANDWLAKLFRYIGESNVGAVGASGSYQSIYSYYLYDLENPRPGAKPSRFFVRRLVGALLRKRKLLSFKRTYDPFPNYHLRTNAFMISRRLMLSLKRKRFRQKSDALEFESGKDGFTKQIYAKGLRILVVGRDGNAYEKEQWDLSRTYCSENQDNLLVGDNRTLDYQQADKIERKELCESVWSKERYARLHQSQ